MNKLSIALLVAGTAAVTGYVVSKVIKNKKRESDSELFEDDYDDCCACGCADNLDVVIPAEEAEDCAEAVKDAAEDAAEAVEDAVEEIKDAAEDVVEEIKD